MEHVSTSVRVHGGAPPENIVQRMEWNWVATTWLLAAACTIALSALFIGAVDLMGFAPFESARASVDAVPLATGFLSFPVFLLVLNLRLLRGHGVQHDRLLHSLAVAGMHVVMLLVVLGAGLVLRAWFEWDASQLLPGTTLEEIGVGFFSLERSAATVIGAALIAPALSPQTGRPPRGAQVGQPPEEHML